MKNKKVGLISLGCAKNLIDGEKMLGELVEKGYQITNDQQNADVIIVNTCGFTDPAKEESINEILSAAKLKKNGKLKAVIVTGCLAQRYKDEILREMPEIDAVLGTGSYDKIAECIEKTLKNGHYEEFGDIDKADLDYSARVVTTPSYTAYLKIAEGCDNHCAYCVIPSLRGKFRSRPMEEIIAEAEALSKSGVKELIVVAQDTTRYGIDLYGERKLSELSERLCRIDGIEKILLHYFYPDEVDDKLLDTIAKEKKIAKYFDIPIQHSSDRVLASMNRRGDTAYLKELFQKIRAKIPNAVLRTTLIVGFPTESEQDFEDLCSFVKEIRFDRLGVFTYSAQEGTKGALLEEKQGIPEEIKEERKEIIMRMQSEISYEKNQKKMNTLQKVLCEGFDDEMEIFFGRGEGDSPDIDTKVYFHSEREINPGDFLNVGVYDCDEFDLYGVAKF